MGLLDWLTGTKRPAEGVVPKPPEEVYSALLAVNRPTAPFVVRDGRPEGVDLVAEWRIVDASWYEVFAKAGLTKAFQVLMRFDEPNHEVRAVDKEFTVEWQAGVPTLSYSAEWSRGQSKQVSWGTAYAFTETGEYGEVYNYRFDSGELKQPLQDAVTGAGWLWRGIAIGEL